MVILRVAIAAILSLVLLIVYLPTVYPSPVLARDRHHSGRYGANMFEKGGNAADAVSNLVLYVYPILRC